MTDYFIVGKEIETRKQVKPRMFRTRTSVPTTEINEAYPDSVRVKLFKNEADALRYASSLREMPADDFAQLPSLKFRPIFKVTYCGKADLNWREEQIQYHYTQFHYEQGNLKTCPTTKQYKEINVETSKADLDKLVQISGNLRSYGYHEIKGDDHEFGKINYQSSFCTLF